MFPIRDDQPRFSTPYVNYFIIALNVLVFVFFELPVQFQGPRHFNALIFQFGFIPEHLTGALHGTSQYPISASLLTIFTSMFLHVDLFHIVGILWFLIQFIATSVTATTTAAHQTGGVAFAAHVGGFVAGLLLIKLFPQRARTYRYGTW